MSRRALIFMFLSILLAVYLGGALTLTTMMAAQEKAAAPEVFVAGNQKYLTPKEILKELPADTAALIADADLEAIERRLMKKDNIEDVQAVRSFCKDKARVNVFVTPMKPVARVFEGSHSYYINRAGKKLTANAQYHIDVPVISGNFSKRKPADVLPLLEYMENDRTFASIVSSISIAKNGDIIIIPLIEGHVINFGEPRNYRNKVRRISEIYRQVMPAKGWHYYDTISVKWDGQVVATKRRYTPPPPNIFFDTEAEETEPNLDYLDTVPEPHTPLSPKH